MATQISLEYLAGIIDGEGCLSISYDKPGSKISPRFVAQLSVVNTNMKLLADLKKQFGGSIHSIRSGQIGRSRRKYKPCGAWTKTATQAAEIATKVLPYLRIKHKQAVLIIKLSTRKTLQGRKRLSKKEIKARFSIWERCGQLNGYRQKRRGAGKHKNAR